MGKYIRKERDSIQMTKDDPAMKLFKECKLELENRLGLKLQKKEVLKLLCELAMPKIKLIKQLLDE